VAAALAEPGARLLPMWRDRCLATGEPPSPLALPSATATVVSAAADTVVFLGLDRGTALFAADLSTMEESAAIEVTGARGTADVRALVETVPPELAATLAYSRGLLHWHRRQRYCGACGSPTRQDASGHVRNCTGAGCGQILFPRIEPAVIMLVEAPDDPPRCLLARHRGAGPLGYSTLAGFVEIGESLEDAVRRELAEEAGVRVRSVRYAASQAWPFPAGIMVGFRAVAQDTTVTVDGEEVIEARWFTRPELVAHEAAGGRLGRVDSIDRFLIRSWLDATA
jgi:NAD+ diphosphatase